MDQFRYPLDPEVLDSIRRSLQHGLAEATQTRPELNGTLSGKAVANPATSRAQMGGVALTPEARGGASEMLRETATSHRTQVRDIAAALQRQRIDQLLMNVGSLDLPTNLPPLPEAKPPVNPITGALTKALRGIGPALVLELLLTPLETNKGEDERLKQYKADDLRSSGGPR